LSWEENPRSTTLTTRPQSPPAQAVTHLPEDRLVVGVARPAPTAHGNPLAGHRDPDNDLRQVTAVVLGVPVAAEPGLAVGTVSTVGAVGGVGVVGL
jgi:hypothetical protein